MSDSVGWLFLGVLKRLQLDIGLTTLKIPKEHFIQRWAQKGHKWYAPNRSRILRKGDKNTQMNYTQKISMTQITTMV